MGITGGVGHRQWGWWCFVTWHRGPRVTLQAEARSGGVGWVAAHRSNRGMVVVIKPGKKKMLVSKKIEVNSKKHTGGPNDASHRLGALCLFIHGGKVPSWVACVSREG